MTLQEFIQQACKKLKNPNYEAPDVTNTSTYAGRIWDLFVSETGKLLQSITLENSQAVFGLIDTQEVSGSNGTGDVTNVSNCAKVLDYEVVKLSGSPISFIYIDKGDILKTSRNIEDWIPDNEIWYRFVGTKFFYYPTAIPVVFSVTYLKNIDDVVTLSASTDLNSYIEPPTQQILLDAVVAERLKEESRL